MLLTLFLLTFFSSVMCSGSGWPDCKTVGEDYTGFDYRAGLRFSAEDCAKWCAQVSPKCKRWVFKEVGTMCHLKYTEGNKRDAENPLTPEDLSQFQQPPDTSSANITSSANATAGNTTSSNNTAANDPNSPRSKLEQQRRNELKLTHTGLPSCQPTEKVYWPECTVLGKKIDGSAIRPQGLSQDTFDVDSMEQCSLNCTLQSDPKCTHWNFLADERECSLHSDSSPLKDVKTSIYGSHACLGMVVEPASPGVPRIDGEWSPWSTLATPCFKPKTGEIVECGGGLQFRYRSCSNPTPRAGGKLCHGKDFKSEACNTHACKLPEEFLWSEWGVPDKLCSVGTQKRTTMCGSLRRRLPNLEGRDSDEPAVYYPRCLMNKANLAPEEDTSTLSGGAATLKDCFTNCNKDPACEHWMFNTTDSKCKFFAIVKYSTEEDMSVVAGRKYCAGTKLYLPYCEDLVKNKNFTADVLSVETDVMSMADCAEKCLNFVNDTCKYWFYIENSADKSKSCEIRGDKGTDPGTDVVLNDTTTYFAPKECQKGIDLPSMPEEALELSYKEICSANQLKVESRLNNTWNKDYCPSPCKDNGECPHSAKCIDESDEKEPKFKCVCQMGLQMVGGRCISPPPTTPTPRPIPSMGESEKTAAKAISKVACIILIGFVSTTLIIFAVFRIIDHGRFIHMNIEIALLAANVCLEFDPEYGSASCRNISMCLHFFFTVVFAFFLLEGVFMYSLLSHVVTSNGMLSYVGNFLFGWGAGICVLAFCISFEYDNYGGEYHCWLEMSSASLTLGQYVPIGVMFIITVVLIEAAGSADETSMPKLSNTSEAQLQSAKYMHRSLILRAGLALGSFVIGSQALYQQELSLFLVFTIINGVLGGLVFFFHCTSNEKIRELLGRCWSRICPGSKKSTELEPLNQDKSKDA